MPKTTDLPEDLMEVLIILGVVAVIALVFWSHHQAKKRAAELAEWARQRSMSFSADPEYGVDEQFGDFASLQRGSNRYAYNITSGVWNTRSILAFDYHYETTSTDDKGHPKTHNHYLSVAILNSGLSLKRVDIRPEGMLDRLAEFLGFDDIDFESDEFSREFHVKAADRKFAFDVIDQRMMEYLLEAPRLAISISGGYLCACNDRTWSPTEFEAALGLLNGFVDRLTPSLVREIKEGV